MYSLLIAKLSSICPGKDFQNSIIQFCTASNIKNLDIHIIDGNLFEINSPQMIFTNYIQLNKHLKQFINEFYVATMYYTHQLNVNFILSNFTLSNHVSDNCYDIVVTNFEQTKHRALNQYIEKQFPHNKNLHLQTIKDSSSRSISNPNINNGSNEVIRLYKSVCVGGTFDRLHVGHKILLTNAAMLAEEFITIGVTDEKMNNKKILKELIEPINCRLAAVDSFISKIKPSLKRNVMPISDMFGPTITDASIDCLVVSEETISGAEKINLKRRDLGFKSLAIEIVKLVRESEDITNNLHKVSSSTQRKTLLGCLLKPPVKKDNLPSDVYIIGMTGGIASGKSSICKRFEKFGAAIIDCDKLGHKSYLPGSVTLSKIIQFFGDEILDSSGLVNRKMLGSIVFKDKAKLNMLNEIVWPAISELALEEIEILKKNGQKVIILDAAVLLEAKWDAFVHEVWTSIIPEAETIKRIMERNNLPLEVAEERIRSQISNQERVDKSNVIFSTYWKEDITQTQVEKAWKLLLERIAQ